MVRGSKSIIPIVDLKGRLVGKFKTRQGIHKSKYREIHPHSHLFLVNKEGKIAVQKRSSNKKYLGGLEIPLSAGGHLTNEDIRQGRTFFGRPIIKLDYQQGALRELKEELGIKNTIDLREVRRLRGNLDFSKHSGFSNFLHTRTFWGIYEEEKHGRIKCNKSEVEKVSWLSPEEIEERKIHLNLEPAQGKKILNEIKRISQKVTSENLS